MKRFSVLLVFLLGVMAPVMPLLAQSDPDTLESRVRQLTAGEFAGRGSGTTEGNQAARLLARWFEQAGLATIFDDEYLQEFPLRGQGWTGDELAGKSSFNVAALLPGSGTLAGRYLVLGAHHDHLGRVDVTLAETGPAPKGTYYPGANDNASGVTVLFELIPLLMADPTPDRRSVLFVSFGGEEVGLQGSGHFVSHLPVARDSIDAMINFDTVGQMTDRRLHVSGVGTTEIFSKMVTAANTDALDLSLAQGGWSGSDHMSFNTVEIPVLFVFGGPYLQYNTVDDIADNLDYAGLAEITQYSGRLIGDLRHWGQKMPWLMVAEKLRPESSDSANKATWFGSLPDFTEEVEGYKLAGVFDGSPAARAGLKKGDVLILLAGQKVSDLQSFTQALRANQPGDLVEVTVLREGNTLNFTVVLGDRKDRR